MAPTTNGPDGSAQAGRLVGSWFHSYEEDRPGMAVFRPASFPFPRARGPRDSLTLEPDGSAAVGLPGPADRTEQAPATWWLADGEVVVESEDGRTLHLAVGGGDQTVLIMRPDMPGRRGPGGIAAGPREGQDDDGHTGG